MVQAVGVLRNINGHHVWYICDLKIDPNCRGQQIPSKMIRKSYIPWLFVSSKFYSCSVEPPENNRICRMLDNMGLHYDTETLYIYMLDYETMCLVHNRLRLIRNFDYVSLDGVKNIELESGGKLNLLHVQFEHNPVVANYMLPLRNYTHCICCIPGEIYNIMQDLGIKENTRQTIVHNLKDVSFIQSCDI